MPGGKKPGGNYRGGNFIGSNCLGGSCSGGNYLRVIAWGVNVRGVIVQEENFMGVIFLGAVIQRELSLSPFLLRGINKFL